MAKLAGYDVGGANLKVAVADKRGKIIAAAEFPCLLSTGLATLDHALDKARAVTEGATVHAVTMTGELSELFPSRRQGVAVLTSHLAGRLGADTRFFMGLKGFGPAGMAAAEWESTGSANYLATARIIAVRRPKCLLIDFGSTTTDIIACDRPQGLTDAERLQTGELVYTGFIRTPVPSVTTRAPLAGQWQSLAGDAFATMEDVRRILGEWPDGGISSINNTDHRLLLESLQRFARGFGRDAELRHLPSWQAAAAYVREQQLRSIHDGALQVLTRPGIGLDNVVTAGIGAVAAEDIGNRLGFKSQRFGQLMGLIGPNEVAASRYAAAAAVALLSVSNPLN